MPCVRLTCPANEGKNGTIPGFFLSNYVICLVTFIITIVFIIFIFTSITLVLTNCKLHRDSEFWKWSEVSIIFIDILCIFHKLIRTAVFSFFQNPGKYDSNRYINSLYECKQSIVAKLNKIFEKFKRDATIHLPNGTRKSGFDIDISREAARPFFQLQKLKFDKVVNGAVCSRRNSTYEPSLDNSTEIKESLHW